MTARVICFDLGGVLIRICRTWAEACASAGLEVRHETWLSDPQWAPERRRVVDAYQRGDLSTTSYYQALSRAIAGLYTPAEVERLHHAWTLDPYPGAPELIAELAARGPTALTCLSNTNDAHWQRLCGSPPEPRYAFLEGLSVRLASHQLGCIKPDARIYPQAQERFGPAGASAPAEVVFFDDLPENVAAARSFGWSAYRIDPNEDPVAQIRARLPLEGL